ncbi:MAG: penicillin acylase family protein [Bacteroidota bacterium]
MKLFRKIVFWSLGIIFLLVISVYIYLVSQKPQYEGAVTLTGLSAPVEVIYDYYGVPHIYASSEEDAYYALGYVHAQDRLFQMEMLRRVASGTLSEVFGKDLLKVDLFFRTLGLKKHANWSQKTFMNSNNQQYQKSANAYLKGINAFVKNGQTPVEFTMLGIPKNEFTVTDMYLSMEFMSFNFAMAFKTDPLMTFIKSKLGDEYYQDLITNFNSQQHSISTNHASVFKSQHAFNTITEIFEKIPVAPLTGSNSWVANSTKTKSGKVLLENDTHIAYGQPGVWYEAHLEYPGYRFYGDFLAGWPFAAVGHTQQLAWGVTMLENDDLDFYEEKTAATDSNKYFAGSKALVFESRKETIKIKGESDVVITVKNSRHGPVMNAAMPELNDVSVYPVAASWTHLKFPSNLMQVTYQLNHASNKTQVREAVSQIISPGLNIMYGDAENNIALWHAGKLLKRNPAMDPVLIQEGWKDTTELAYYTFDEHPSIENPTKGFIVNSNQQLDTMADGSLYPGYYTPYDRYWRGEHLLKDKNNLLIDDFQLMAFDDVSPVTPQIARTIIEGVSSKVKNQNYIYQDAARKLIRWDGKHGLHDVAPTIFYKLLYHIFYEAMADELGKEKLEAYFMTHVAKNSYLPFIKNDNAVWWNNIATKDVVESKNDILDKAFTETVKDLIKELGSKVSSWEWGRVHELELKHAIGKVKPFNWVFNVGPFPASGGPEVINQSGFLLSGDKIHSSLFGPAMRNIIDFSDIENSKSVLPNGQSGNLMSRWYDDQTILYLNGNYRKMKMNRTDIVKNKTGKLILQPNGLK